MALLDDVEETLRAAGNALKQDMWLPQDAAFLRARAKDLVGLQRKAALAKSDAAKAAYIAAARDVVHHVTLLAVIRLETAQRSALETVGKLFVDKVLPMLVKLLPALIGL